MSKIGILTFHKVPNFGASLQAFALKKFLGDYCGDGSVVEIIDYECVGNDSSFSADKFLSAASTSRNIVRRFCKRILMQNIVMPDYKEKCRRFTEFSNRYFQIRKYGPGECVNYDYVFLGSDQIWNPNITNGFQNAYFGQDPQIVGKYTASYAASCGDINGLTDADRQELYERVSKIDHVGVREISLYDNLAQHGIENNFTMDPTFLLDKSEYEDTFHLTKEPGEPTLLIYELQPDTGLDALAKNIAEKRRLKIQKICGYVDFKHIHNKKEITYHDGPIDFLKKAYGAEYIITNSFHGIAFSIIFKKNFSAVLPAQRRSRIVDLLGELHLKDRIYDSPHAATGDIDYSEVNVYLSRLIAQSREYISRVFEGETNHGKI